MHFPGQTHLSQNYFVVDVSMPNPMATIFLTLMKDAVKREYDYIVTSEYMLFDRCLLDVPAHLYSSRPQAP